MDETLQLPRRLSTASNDRSPSPHHSRQPSTDTDKTGEGYWSEIERAELSQAAHDDDHLSTDEDCPDSPSKLKLSDESPKHDSQPWTEQHDTVFKVTSMIPAFVKGTCEAIAVPYFLAEGVPFATAFLILCAGPLLLREIEPMLDGTRLWLSTASFGIFMGSMLLICSWRIGTALADPHHAPFYITTIAFCGFVVLDVSTSLMAEAGKLMMFELSAHRHISKSVLEWIRRWSPFARVIGILVCAFPIPICLHAWFAVPAMLGLVGAIVIRTKIPRNTGHGHSRRSSRDRGSQLVGGLTDDNPVVLSWSCANKFRGEYFWAWLCHLLSWVAVLAQVYMWTAWAASVYRLENGLTQTDMGWRDGVHWGARSLALQGFVSSILQDFLRSRDGHVPPAVIFASQTGFMLATLLLCSPHLQETHFMLGVSVLLGVHHAMQLEHERTIGQTVHHENQLRRTTLLAWLNSTVQWARLLAGCFVTLFCLVEDSVRGALAVPALCMLMSCFGSMADSKRSKRQVDALAAQLSGFEVQHYGIGADPNSASRERPRGAIVSP